VADTTSRALKLLSLLQSRRIWTGPELMARLGVSERTLRRDIDRLRDLGYRVDSFSGPAGGYQLAAGSDIPPLLLDEEEASAIAMGLLTAAGGTIEGMEEISLRALAKLEQVLPPATRLRLTTLQTAIEPLIRSWITVDADTLTILAQACRDRERVRFLYRRRDGEQSERHVEPHQLVPVNQRWYLLGYDRDRDDWRTFRLDRLDEPKPTRINFPPRDIPGGSAARYVEESLRAAPMRYQVTATLHAPAGEVSRATHDAGTVEPLGKTRSRWKSQGDSLEWLAFQLIWLGVPFQIHEPPELIAYVHQLSDRLAGAVVHSS
jgi:predicted DNA-binding transcriptional regulator YafY